MLSYKLIENYTMPGFGLYKAVACAVILSRRVGNHWYRSTERLSIIGEDEQITKIDGGYLGDAILSYLSETNSSLYLNQAKRL
jgi:hypothetical protein